MVHDTASASSKLARAAVLYLCETNMHGSYMQLMYVKYTLFYKSPKQCVPGLSLRGEGPGDEATGHYNSIVHIYGCSHASVGLTQVHSVNWAISAISVRHLSSSV